MRPKPIIFIFVLASLFINGQTRAQPLNECGNLIGGVEGGCVLFVLDTGGVFEVRGDVSPFGVGETVRIAGVIDSACFTFCQQGPCLNVISITSCTLIPCCTNPGDASGDGNVNIADITFLIKRIFSGVFAPECCAEGDADGSGRVNIIDITYLIKRIFAGGPPPICGPLGTAC